MLHARHIPKEPFVVACSGGVDSMAVLHFLLQSHRNKISVVYINHGTEYANIAQQCVEEFCKKEGVLCATHTIDPTLPQGLSKEAVWRDRRYEVFHALDKPVITAHHLDDCIETWVFSSLHGLGKIIPFANQNVIRPFLLTKKSELDEYCARKKVPFVVDPSNQDTNFARNNIRHKLLPLCLEINPGITKTIGKKVQEMLQNQSSQVQVSSAPSKVAQPPKPF